MEMTTMMITGMNERTVKLGVGGHGGEGIGGRCRGRGSPLYNYDS